jgi:hypothetical protein
MGKFATGFSGCCLGMSEYKIWQKSQIGSVEYRVIGTKLEKSQFQPVVFLGVKYMSRR